MCRFLLVVPWSHGVHNDQSETRQSEAQGNLHCFSGFGFCSAEQLDDGSSPFDFSTQSTVRLLIPGGGNILNDLEYCFSKIGFRNYIIIPFMQRQYSVTKKTFF